MHGERAVLLQVVVVQEDQVVIAGQRRVVGAIGRVDVAIEARIAY